MSISPVDPSTVTSSDPDLEEQNSSLGQEQVTQVFNSHILPSQSSETFPSEIQGWVLLKDMDIQFTQEHSARVWDALQTWLESSDEDRRDITVINRPSLMVNFNFNINVDPEEMAKVLSVQQ